MAEKPSSDQGPLTVDVSRSHTIRHTYTHTYTRQDSPDRVICSSQRPLPTRHTINTIYGTAIPTIERMDAGLRHRQHGHWVQRS